MCDTCLDLISLLKPIIDGICHCNDQLDKETGASPEEASFKQKNSWGDPIWGEEPCNYCKARILINKLESS